MANDQQFCLRWNNHQSTLISVFDSLLENGTLVDCTLAAEGQYLKAHKVVLSACSPYLETLLSQHYEKHPIVILKDVKFTELKSMMDYMYRGEVNISQDQLGTFLKAAESLQIKGLSDNGDDARDVGSTAKKPDAPRPSVTQTRAPVESKRPAPVGDMSDTSRDGSISPSSLRKRRRTRRPSQGDDPDSNLDNSICDLPAAQSTPMPVPSAAPVQSLPKQIVKTEPPPPMPEPVKKEILDPPAEPLLEPKTEYLDYMNNENSIEVEDLTLDDDDEDGMDSSMDASRPGPSHGDLSQQGGYPPWTMTGDQSGTDEIFMAAQEAVGAATGQQQRDSQGIGSSNGALETVFVVSSTSQVSDVFFSELTNPAVESRSQVNGTGSVCLGKETEELNKALIESQSEDKCVVRIYPNRVSSPSSQKPSRAKMLTVKDRIRNFQNKRERKTLDLKRLDQSSFGRNRKKLEWSGDSFSVKKHDGENSNNLKYDQMCEKDLKTSICDLAKEQLANEQEKKNLKHKYLYYPLVSRKNLQSNNKETSKNRTDKNTFRKGQNPNNTLVKPCSKKGKRSFKIKCHIPKGNFECDECGLRYKYKRGLRQHQRYACDMCSTSKIKCRTPKGDFECDKCGLRYKYKRGLRHHQKSACDNTLKFSCHLCDYKSSYKRTLKYHMESVHSCLE